MSEHNYMNEDLKKQLHTVVEQIDHVHAEKEQKLKEHQKVLTEFLAKMPHFAAEFSREINKPDYQVTSDTVLNQNGQVRLVVKRHRADFATITLDGSANSEGTQVVYTSSYFGIAQSGKLESVDGGIHQRLSKVLIDALKAAGERINKI